MRKIIQKIHNSLTPREKEILSHLLLGKTYREISGDLSLSIRTVENNMSNIKTKFNCSTLNKIYAHYIDPALVTV